MNPQKIEEAFTPLILSASGWRKVFAADGLDESLCTEITPEDRLLVAAMARVYAGLVKDEGGQTITLGIDSRPTGPAMAQAMIPIYLNAGLEVRYTGICAAPEIMAWTGSDQTLDGFCYISASHNPPGHNGVKFGLGGGVIGGKTATDLINSYKKTVGNVSVLSELETLLKTTPPNQVKDVMDQMVAHKNTSYESYAAFTRLVASGREKPREQKDFFSLFKNKITTRPLGVIAELNGSARSLSIDEAYLSDLGIKVKTLNNTPGCFVHPIVPEGENLNLCRTELEKARQEDKDFILGYVPDCDGDRGNLVYYNEKTGQAEILEAQEVFALSVLAELSSLAYGGADMTQAAVAVNGPTSLRIDRIAESLGAQVFRAEVGEANVVNKAVELRKKGYQVPILGEGSNGGNITHPAQVRDPLNTLTALMKLLLITDEGDKSGLFHLWCDKSGQSDKYRADFTLADIITTLPAFSTTSAFDREAKFTITTTNHALLKDRYEKLFPAQWEARQKELADRYGITGWEERNMEGTEERTGMGAPYRSGAEKGGFKILFHNDQGRFTDYIWMRGSGTEPVFRVLADCEGNDPEREAYFLAWHKEIIATADKG
jgi:phosphoglucomutase